MLNKMYQTMIFYNYSLVEQTFENMRCVHEINRVRGKNWGEKKPLVLSNIFCIDINIQFHRLI